MPNHRWHLYDNSSYTLLYHKEKNGGCMSYLDMQKRFVVNYDYKKVRSDFFKSYSTNPTYYSSVSKISSLQDFVDLENPDYIC